MYHRNNETLGTVTYRGQRGFVVEALLNPHAGVPETFSASDVESAIDPAAYEQRFKKGKMKVTVLDSVGHHLRELCRLGQIENAGQPLPAEHPLVPASEERGESNSVDHQLLTEWRNWAPTGPPFLLEADAPRFGNGERTVSYRNWPETIADPEFGRPGDVRFHVGLLPQPFIGNLRHASIYVLSLNPGTDPTDYFGEYEVAAYRESLISNLKQFSPNVQPFIFLDPRFSWHGGFRWWHRKLSGVIEIIAASLGLSFAAARAELAGRLASLELVPYHSNAFGAQSGWVRSLRSVELARTFVSDFVIPRVRAGEAVVIAMRGVLHWELPNLPGVIRYESRHARGAHLTPHSDGGRAILEQLGIELSVT